MSIKHTAFLDIEDALSGRLRGAWSRYWGPLARQIDAAVARGDFDTAHKLTDTLDAQVVFDKSRRAIETLSMSSLLLGASRVSPVKRSRMAKAPRLDVVESATRQLGLMIGRNMTEALREDAHGYLSSLELTPVSNLPVAKLDDPKAAEREFLRIRLNTRGKAYFALAASLQVSRLTAFGFLAEAVEAGVEFYKIDAVLDDRTCPICKIMDGKVFPIEAGFKHAEMILAVDDPDTLKEVAPFYAQNKLAVAKLATMSTDELIERGLLLPAYHFLCLTGDAPITASPDVLGVTRRWYEGNVFVITTASQKKLAITGNHPVLTRRGWVPAKFLKVGDQVVRCLRDDVALPFMDDHQGVPPTISQVADAFLAARQVVSREVPTSAEDFHGDGVEGQVTVVGTDSELRLRYNAEVAQSLAQDSFVGTAEGGPLGLCRSHFALALEGDGGADEGGMGGADLSDPLFRGHESPLAAFRFALGTQGGTRLNQAPFNDVARDAQLVAELQNGRAGPVAFDDVVNIEIQSVACHVYNLETTEGWYAADTIIVHNCRCIIVRADAPVEAVAPTAGAVTPASQALYGQQDPEVILQRLFGLTPARPVEADLPWRSGDVSTPPRETPPLFAGEIRPTAPLPAEARTRLDTALQTASSTEFATPTMQQTRPPLWRRVVPSAFVASLLAWLGFSSTQHKEQEPEPEDDEDEDEDEDDETPEDTRP